MRPSDFCLNYSFISCPEFNLLFVLKERYLLFPSPNQNQLLVLDVILMEKKNHNFNSFWYNNCKWGLCISFLFPSLRRKGSMTYGLSFLQNPPLQRNAKYFLVMNHCTMIQYLLKSQKKLMQRKAMKTWIAQ